MHHHGDDIKRDAAVVNLNGRLARVVQEHCDGSGCLIRIRYLGSVSTQWEPRKDWKIA